MGDVSAVGSGHGRTRGAARILLPEAGAPRVGERGSGLRRPAAATDACDADTHVFATLQGYRVGVKSNGFLRFGRGAGWLWLASYQNTRHERHEQGYDCICTAPLLHRFLLVNRVRISASRWRYARIPTPAASIPQCLLASSCAVSASRGSLRALEHLRRLGAVSALARLPGYGGEGAASHEARQKPGRGD